MICTLLNTIISFLYLLVKVFRLREDMRSRKKRKTPALARVFPENFYENNIYKVIVTNYSFTPPSATPAIMYLESIK